MHTLTVSVEIERKFVPAEQPAADMLGPGTPMRQGYLAEENDVEVRVRIAEPTAVLTLKAGSGLTRRKIELPISLEQAEALWPHTTGRRIDKTRHRVALSDDGLVAEVDIYAGALSGLCMVEVEFESEASARTFSPPKWFGSRGHWRRSVVQHLARSSRPRGTMTRAALRVPAAGLRDALRASGTTPGVA